MESITMNEQIAKEIIEDLIVEEEFTAETAKQLSSAYTTDEMSEALSMYPKIEGVEIDLLQDETVGIMMVQYEARTGDKPDMEGLLEELILTHYICFLVGEDLFNYNDTEMLRAFDLDLF